MTARPSAVFTLPLTLAVPALAQVPRTPVQLDPGTAAGNDPSVAVEGDLSAVVWRDELVAQIFLSTSDGRGLEWSEPMRADEDATGAFKLPDGEGAAISGDRIYAVWDDTRFGTGTERDTVLNVFDAQLGAFVGEVVVPSGYPVGTSISIDREIAASSVGGNEVFHVLQTVDPVGSGSGLHELWLSTSLDGGASFSAQQLAPPLPGQDADDVELVVDGANVYVAWMDDRFPGDEHDVFFRASSDSGGTFGPELRLTLTPEAKENQFGDVVSMDVRGSAVAVSWAADNGAVFSDGQSIKVRVSLDGGATFGPEANVSGLVDTVYGTGVALTSSGNVVVGWADNSSGSPQAYAATSTDSGASFGAPTLVSPLGISLITTPQVGAVDGGGEDGAALLWSDASGDRAQSVYSHDGGLTWGATLTLATSTGSVFDRNFAVGSLYKNVIATWKDSPAGGTLPGVFVGGYRPQTLTPVGFVGGVPTNASFTFERFHTSSSVAWALLSLAPGTTPLVDGRNLGLAFDPLLSSSLNLALTGVLSAPISALRSGSTVPVPITFPTGLTLYAAGLGFNFTTLLEGDVTDVVEISL
ncbi:MAG: sialidase family protein [Planctomycetota bacterium]